MFAHVKKRKVTSDCCAFNNTLTAQYFFTEVKGEAVYLVRGTQVTVFKDNNLNHLYMTEHKDKIQELVCVET